jgi:low temperature requirement protein LtrA
MPTSPTSDPVANDSSERWLDLFYDLVFVAAILILSSVFSHAESVAEGFWYGAAFVSIWWVWLATTMHANRYPGDDIVHRLLMLIQMFLVALVAIAASDGVHAHPELVSTCYSLLTLSVAFIYVRTRAGTPHADVFARRRAVEYAAAALIFLIAGALPDTARIIVWTIGLAVTIVPAVAHWTGEPPLQEHHLIERLGALTIIMCGEAFVKVALAADNNSLDNIDVVTIALEFILVFAVWATYFDDVPHAGVDSSPRSRSIWLAAHLLLHLGIIGVAIGVSRFVTFHPGEDIPTPDVAAVAIPLAEIYLALIVVNLASRRRPLTQLIQIRLLAVLAVGVVVVIAEWATWFDTYWSVAAFAFVAITEAGIEALARKKTTVLEPAAT